MTRSTLTQGFCKTESEKDQASPTRP